jgi:hypothetical protein
MKRFPEEREDLPLTPVVPDRSAKSKLWPSLHEASGRAVRFENIF